MKYELKPKQLNFLLWVYWCSIYSDRKNTLQKILANRFYFDQDRKYLNALLKNYQFSYKNDWVRKYHKGDWVKIGNDIYRINKIDDKLVYCNNSKMEISFDKKDYQYKLRIQSIEDYLADKANEMGFEKYTVYSKIKDGKTIKGIIEPGNLSPITIREKGSPYLYNPKEDIFNYFGSAIYKQGQWAEIQ